MEYFVDTAILCVRCRFTHTRLTDRLCVCNVTQQCTKYDCLVPHTFTLTKRITVRFVLLTYQSVTFKRAPSALVATCVDKITFWFDLRPHCHRKRRYKQPWKTRKSFSFLNCNKVWTNLYACEIGFYRQLYRLHTILFFHIHFTAQAALKCLQWRISGKICI